MSSKDYGHVVKTLTLRDLKQVSGGFAAFSDEIEIAMNGQKLKIKPSVINR